MTSAYEAAKPQVVLKDQHMRISALSSVAARTVCAVLANWTMKTPMQLCRLYVMKAFAHKFRLHSRVKTTDGADRPKETNYSINLLANKQP